MQKTKIIATIGPASEDEKILQKMFELGLDVCRLNFSHGDYKWHDGAIKKIRKSARKAKRQIGIMADIQGPRIRVAAPEKLKVRKGEKIFVTDEKSLARHKHKKEIILDWDNFYQYLDKKDVVFIEDGLISLKVQQVQKGGCVAEVIDSGEIKKHKGVNIPAISAHLGFLTDKDLKDIEFVLPRQVDFIAVSFVSSASDIIQLRKIIDHYNKKQSKLKKSKISKRLKPEEKIDINQPWIVAKIERKKALKNIDEIIEEADAVMVARGDLAIEVPQEKVCVMQKKIISKCLKAGKPVIVATQMMVSMIKSARPTRAEISDITNAVVDQADAVMLSNETAVGKYPVKVIETMAKVISETEKSPYNDRILKKRNRFARMILRLQGKGKKRGRKKSAKALNLDEALNFSSLRQEAIDISLETKKVSEKRKGSLIWGVRS